MTNYIICLSHFCEQHGPSIVMCTQKVPLKESARCLLTSTSSNATCKSCKLLLPDPNTSNIQSDIKDISYITTQYPASQTRYSSLRKIVTKSLSVETTDPTKPMMFGDSLIGYSIIRIFKVKDMTARGAERKYSIIVTSDDESDIIKNWDIITSNLTEIIDFLKNRIRVIEKLNIESTSISSEKGSDVTHSNERFLRRSLIKSKSLVQLTDDDQLFAKLHIWAYNLLQDLE